MGGTYNTGKKKSKNALRIFLILVITCALICFAFDLFVLKIETIEVVGSTMYSDDSIIEASGIELNKSFIFTFFSDYKEDIIENFPGIHDLSESRRFPSTLVLNITESLPKMYVSVGDSYYTLDENLVVLEKTESIEAIERKNLLRVFLPNISGCIVGDHLKTSDEQATKTLVILFEGFEKYDLMHDVKDIDVTDVFDIQFTLGSKYKVKLGSAVDCEIKLEFLKGILAELDEDELGVIDLSSGDIREAIFSRG